MRLSLDVDLDTEAIVEVYDQLGNTRPLLREAAVLIQQGIRENFERQGSSRGPWRPLAPSTQRTRQALGRGPSSPILQRGIGGPDGRVLLEALTSEDALWYGTDELIVSYPDRGDARFRSLSAVRPMLALGRDFERDMELLLGGWFD